MTALVALATLFPLSLPSLALELAWNLKLDLPRQIDWREIRAIAGVIERDRLNDRLVSVYFFGLGNAIAVYTPVRLERGHWVEVQPRVDASRELSAAAKAYVVPLAPDDVVLRDLERRGPVRIHGGTPRMTVVTLPRPGPVAEAIPLVAEIVSAEAAWLAAHAANNVMPPPADLLSPVQLRQRRVRLNAQRTRVGRIEVVVLVWAHALERVSPELARGARGAARGFGSMAPFLGDDSNIGFMSDARHERLRQNLARVAEAVKQLSAGNLAPPALSEATDRLFAEYFWAA